ncbi:hypothetical protein E4T48_05609 [Aureobasidium sp. EXF-10727]|nr:hypothetical protein E4T48_05609 [Aureobasidium sp. EXF-10727]
MPIRPATWADLKPAARTAALAFWEDELHGTRLHPHRSKHPKSFERFFLHDLRENYCDAECQVWVSHPQHHPEKITGMAVWMRTGEGGRRLHARQSWLRWLMSRLVLPVYHKIDLLLHPNNAADAAGWRDMEKSFPFMEHHFEKPGYDETWDLVLLFQAPQYQGCGYGTELVRWGLEQAKEEGIRVSLVSSKAAEGFYMKLGIDEHVGNASDGGENNPFHDLSGGKILLSKKFEKTTVEEV